jgi:hypothetical protein
MSDFVDYNTELLKYKSKIANITQQKVILFF